MLEKEAMNTQQERRKQFLVDEAIQHGLARRITMYFCMTWLVVFAFPILARMMTQQLSFDLLASQIMEDFWFPIVISIFLWPIVIWQSLRFSNRVAGPVYRINKAVVDMTEGREVQTICVRETDFCQELTQNLNLLIEKTNASASSVDKESKNTVEPVA